jgi:hypothetical protein
VYKRVFLCDDESDGRMNREREREREDGERKKREGLRRAAMDVCVVQY